MDGFWAKNSTTNSTTWERTKQPGLKRRVRFHAVPKMDAIKCTRPSAITNDSQVQYWQHHAKPSATESEHSPLSAVADATPVYIEGTKSEAFYSCCMIFNSIKEEHY